MRINAWIATACTTLAAPFALAPTAGAALSLGITTPTVAMSLTPGATASASGTLQ